MERYIAIDNMGLWPNLTRLKDQTLGTLVFNQPCHGTRPGAVEAWRSCDGGRVWQRMGIPVPHGPDEMRMNVAAGLAEGGDWLCAVWGWGGWSRELETSVTEGRITRGDFWTQLHPVVAKVSRSSDQGLTWQIIGELPGLAGYTPLVPYGNIHPGADGCLRMCAYAYPLSLGSVKYLENAKAGGVFFLTSRDSGCSWEVQSRLPIQGGGETAPIHTGNGHWLAAVRVLAPSGAQHLSLCESDDDGKTWREGEMLGIRGAIPGALLQMKNRLLLVHGGRYLNHNGIYSRVYDAENQGWTTPRRLVDLTGAGDVGYPSAAINSQGEIVVSYYADRSPCHDRYHMGVLIFDETEL